jgi:hypothetical protein
MIMHYLYLLNYLFYFIIMLLLIIVFAYHDPNAWISDWILLHDASFLTSSVFCSDNAMVGCRS